MSIAILADLHLDMWVEDHKDPFLGVDPEKLGSVRDCILAGDISNHGVKKWPRMIDVLREKMPNAEFHIFPGNHDFYGGHIDREDKLEAAAQAAGAHYAQKKSLVIGDTRFLCTTLWTDFRLHGITSEFAAKYDAENALNDYRKIRVENQGYRRLSASVVQGIHFDHLSWLTDELEKEFDGKTVVVTHHAPHQSLCMDPHAKYAPAYASDLSSLISQFQPDAWFCGHSHSYHALHLGGTLVRNVSFGYPWELKNPDHRLGRLHELLCDARSIVGKTVDQEGSMQNVPGLP